MRRFQNWIMDPKRRGALLVTPAIVLLFVMNIFPLMWSFGLSFYHYKASYWGLAWRSLGAAWRKARKR